MKPSSRYSTYESRASDDFKPKLPISTSSSRAVVKSKPSSDPNLTTMVRKFIEKRSSSSSKPKPIGPTTIPDGLKNTAAKSGSNFAALHRKLFGKAVDAKKKEVKALTEVKASTRTLAMVLRSERELLSLNKEQESEIVELKLMLQDKNTEVEKLKDLCLKQREEIKALKSTILFPDAMNSELQELLEKQGSELKQAKQVIPSLQRQVTSLTDQLQCLVVDLAEVKSDKQSVRSCFQSGDSISRTPMYHHKDSLNSLDFSSCDPTSPGSLDDMFLKDLNPCLTPFCAKSKSKEFDEMGYYSPHGYDESLSKSEMEYASKSCARKLAQSSDRHQPSETESRSAHASRRSGDAQRTYGNRPHRSYF